MQKTCTQCGSAFDCASDDPSKTCWCAELPKVISPTDTKDCLCPKCLKERIDKLQHESAGSATEQ